MVLIADRINKSLKRPLPFFILKVDQCPVQGRPESRNTGFGRPDSFMPTHRDVRAKTFCNVWSYDFYDMTLSIE